MEVVEQPGPGKGPMAFGGRFGDVQDGGGLFESQAGEESELDQLRVLGVVLGEEVESGAEGFHGLGGFESRQGDGLQFGEVDAEPTAPVTRGPFAAGIVDEDLAHSASGGGIEMGLAVPVVVAAFRNLEPGFVDKSRGLEGLAGRFRGEFAGRQGAKLIVDLGQQVRRVVRQWGFVRDVAHRCARRSIGVDLDAPGTGELESVGDVEHLEDVQVVGCADEGIRKSLELGVSDLRQEE